MKQITQDWLQIASLDLEAITHIYPGELGLLPEGKPNQKQAIIFYEFAQNIFKSVKSYLELQQ